MRLFQNIPFTLHSPHILLSPAHNSGSVNPVPLNPPPPGPQALSYSMYSAGRAAVGTAEIETGKGARGDERKRERIEGEQYSSGSEGQNRQ
jgi:hypothetical protein